MKFISWQTKGRGRAKKIGFPTINLVFPKNLNLEEGVYGAKVLIGDEQFLAAMHYGSSPTFSDKERTLELFLINVKEIGNVFGKKITVEIIKYLRPIRKFKDKEELVKQIKQDVDKIIFPST